MIKYVHNYYVCLINFNYLSSFCPYVLKWIFHQKWDFLNVLCKQTKLDLPNLRDHFFPFPPIRLAGIFWKWYWFYAKTHTGINQNRTFCEFSKSYYSVIHYRTLLIYDSNNSNPQIKNQMYVSSFTLYIQHTLEHSSEIPQKLWREKKEVEKEK